MKKKAMIIMILLGLLFIIYIAKLRNIDNYYNAIFKIKTVAQTTKLNEYVE